jgi:hypothetical protein
MTKLLAAIAALLLAPMSAHADYRVALQWHHSVVAEHQDARWACVNELYERAEYKIAITHYDSRTRESHCFVFTGRLLGRETQVISFDGIGGGRNFGSLTGNPDVLMVHSKCRIEVSGGVYQQPNYGRHLRTGAVGVGYELVLALSTPDTYQSAKVLVRGQRLWNRDCLVS